MSMEFRFDHFLNALIYAVLGVVIYWSSHSSSVTR